MQNLRRIIFKDIFIRKALSLFSSAPHRSSNTLKYSDNPHTFTHNILSKKNQPIEKMSFPILEESKLDMNQTKNAMLTDTTIEIEELVDTTEDMLVRREYPSKKLKLNKGIHEKLTNFVLGCPTNLSTNIIINDVTSQIPTAMTNELREEKLLPREFFTVDPVTLAKNLLGKVIVRKVDGQLIKCKIVETEAYGGVEDKGCHAYGGKMTDRTKHLYQQGGHLYVYLIYGLSYCMNFTASIEGEPTAVLIRAVEIIEGYDFVVLNRNMKNLSKLGKELVNGPGKLCAAMKIDKSNNTHDVTEAGELFVVDGDNIPFEIVVSKRINIDYAEEYIDKPWRFYIKDNKFVSVKGAILEVISPFGPIELVKKDVVQISDGPSLLLESLEKFRAPAKLNSRRQLGKK